MKRRHILPGTPIGTQIGTPIGALLGAPFCRTGIALLASVATVSLAAPPAAIEGPASSILPNGIHLVTVPRAGSGAVLVAAIVQAGAIDEPSDRAGLSHFLEHLLFDGFDQLDERAVTELFSGRSAYTNATTREGATIYFGLAPREQARAVADGIAGMLFRSTIPAAAFEKEKKVILEELAKDQTFPGAAENAAKRALLWSGTPLEHDSGGTKETVQAAQREETIAYWRAHYRPDRITLLLMGDAKNAELVALAEPFKQQPKGKGASPRRVDPLTWPGWGKWRSAEAKRTELSAALLAPGVDPAGGRLLADWLADKSGPLASLDAELSVQFLPVLPTPRFELAIAPASTATANEDLLPRLLGALDALASEGPTASEADELWRLQSARAEATRQRFHYVAILEGEMIGATAPNPAAWFSSQRPDDAALKRAAASFKSAAPRLRALLSRPGEPQDWAPLPAPIQPASKAPAASGRSSGEQSGSSASFTLPNGLTVVAKSEPGGPIFGIELMALGRSQRESGFPIGTAELVHRLIGSGTTISPGAAFRSRLDRAAIEVKLADDPSLPFDDYYNRAEYSYIRLEGPTAEFDATITLLAEMIKTPQWSTEQATAALETLGRSREASARGSQAVSLALRRRLLGVTHPSTRAVAGFPGDPLPTIDDARQLLGSWPGGYFDPPHLLLSIVSPRALNELREQVNSLLGDGPPTPPHRFLPVAPAPQTGADGEASDSTGSAKPQITVAFARSAVVDRGEAPALLLAIAALSDRMVAEIREKQGLAYRLGASASSLGGAQWWIEGTIGTRPENRERVVATARQLLAELAAAPPSGAKLGELIAAKRRQEMLDRLAAISRAHEQAIHLLEGDEAPSAFSASAWEGVTPEQVAAAARRYLDPASFLFGP